jgi:hypothetical protein
MTSESVRDPLTGSLLAPSKALLVVIDNHQSRTGGANRDELRRLGPQRSPSNMG